MAMGVCTTFKTRHRVNLSQHVMYQILSLVYSWVIFLAGSFRSQDDARGMGSFWSMDNSPHYKQVRPDVARRRTFWCHDVGAPNVLYGITDGFLFICSLVEDYGDKKRWIFFCEDETIINLPGLVKVLNNYNARKVCGIKFWVFLSQNDERCVNDHVWFMLSFPNCKLAITHCLVS